jgi:arsenite methyltransferase
MAQLVFDENMVEQLEKVYATRDILRRRRLVREALAPAPGERILDMGCGPGFYAVEVLQEVGDEGSVVGVDTSAAMLGVAANRARGRPNGDFRQGDATALPVEDGEFDAALSVQVLEYVADATAALRELRRSLRPGGRVVVWDVDWATLSWHSEDPARMARMLEAWDTHLVHPSLAAHAGNAHARGRVQGGARRGPQLHDGGAGPGDLRRSAPSADRGLRGRPRGDRAGDGCRVGR